ncbi:unnamed protein product, partial [Vitis vinifera]
MKGQNCYEEQFIGNASFTCYQSELTEKNWLWKFITNDLFLPFIRGLLSPNTLKFRGLREELGNCGLYYPCNTSMIGKAFFTYMSPLLILFISLTYIGIPINVLRPNSIVLK